MIDQPSIKGWSSNNYQRGYNHLFGTIYSYKSFFKRFLCCHPRNKLQSTSELKVPKTLAKMMSHILLLAMYYHVLAMYSRITMLTHKKCSHGQALLPYRKHNMGIFFPSYVKVCLGSKCGIGSLDVCSYSRDVYGQIIQLWSNQEKIPKNKNRRR